MSLQIWSGVLWAVCAFLLLWKRAGIYVCFHSELGNVSVHKAKKYWRKVGNQSRGNPVLSWETFCTDSFQGGSLCLAVGLCKLPAGCRRGLVAPLWMHIMEMNLSQNKPQFWLYSSPTRCTGNLLVCPWASPPGKPPSYVLVRMVKAASLSGWWHCSPLLFVCTSQWCQFHSFQPFKKIFNL